MADLVKDGGEGVVAGRLGADGAEEARGVGVGREKPPADGRHLPPSPSPLQSQDHYRIDRCLNALQGAGCVGARRRSVHIREHAVARTNSAPAAG